jgi:hypothetical protein
MHYSKQFHIFHGRNDFSSDQIGLIISEVEKRRRILGSALENLQQAMNHIEPKTGPAFEPSVKTRNKVTSKQLSKRPDSSPQPNQSGSKKALKGRVSYKVRGPGGKLMNINEIKNRINSIYDGNQGIIKQ